MIKPLTLAVAIALAQLGTNADAASCTLTTNGTWQTPGNWSCGVRPVSGDSATINLAGVVTINQAEAITTLSNAGTINIDQFLLTLVGGGSTTNTGTINVGSAITGALQVFHNVNNTGGIINVSNGSVINQFGVSISGGTINTTGTGKLSASNSGSNVLSAVTLNGTLDLATATGVQRITNGLTLNGTIDIALGSVLAPQGSSTFNGTGTIVFSDSNASNRFNMEAGTIVLGSGITVRGHTGVIGQQAFVGGAATLTNQGVIAADVAGGTISVNVNNGVVNQGTMRAQNGGTLRLDPMGGGGVNNNAGTLFADNGSNVLLNGVTVTGGAINSAGTGALRATNNGNNYLNAATVNGLIDLASATSVLRLNSGGMVLNGTLQIGSGSVFASEGTQTISGTGTIAFVDAGNNRLNVEAGALTIGSGVTVRGGNGTIGQQAFVGGAATLTNNGTITADVAGQAITIAVNGLTTNNATLSALNGGILNLNSAITGTTGSQIVAGAGSVVNQNGITISGDMNLAGAGSFRASNNGNNFLSGVTLSGTLDLASALGVERVAGGLTLNGATINIGNASVLAPQGNQTISGTGTIAFVDAGNNRLNVEAGALTIGSGVTVRGGNGTIGQQAFVGGAATLTNNGTITADVAGQAITIAVNGLTTNNATLSALNGGILNLNSAITGTTGSQIVAGAGSVVNQNGITISGDMNLAGAGSFRASNNGNNFLSGVTLSGTLDLASALGVERVAGGLTLNGATINIGNASVLAPQGNQTIGGTGTIVFADADANNRLNIEAGTTTLAAGITVRGGNGIIGNQSFVGGAATLINQGVISADVSGRTITVQTTAGTTNQNLMKAENGGTLLLQGSSVDNSAGTLLAANLSTVRVNGITVTGGALNSSGSGRFTATNSGNNFLNGVTLNGVLDLGGGGIARISSGGMTLNGRIDISAGGVLAPQGTQTIGGTGQIVFADGNTANRLNIEAGALTIGAGVTVRGQTGAIGAQNFIGGAATLTNLGTINADGGGTITIVPNGALVNDGLFRAQAGTLAVQRNVSGTGTLQIDSVGSMTLTNGGNAQGTLAMGSAGAALNIGTGNLTITSDYTNAAFGTGNSFNNRAGVSGAGLIVAGGDAAQAITGTNVTNGSTANATLTIGNVRVGSTTYNYEIANTGTTGPSLRGAIQTTANGGNITDARLSGTGVTASNYNTGGPGSDTGNLAVTFNAASAGTLAPLTGQVLNLRSNFSDIGDQKLNIVLGAGAAAYNAAVGNATPSPVVNLGNVRVGGSLGQTFTVSNTAVAGAFSEDLNASFGTATGNASSTGSIAGLQAGSSNNSTMSASLSTGSAGAKNGTVTFNYDTAGAVAGVSNGLGIASVGSQVVTLSGNVYNVAVGSATPTPVTLANQRVGGTGSQVLTVSNTAAVGNFSEALNASFSGSTGAASGTGSVNNLIAGGSNNNALSVGVNTGSAGAKTGTVTLAYQTDGTGLNGNSGLAAIGAGNQVINVSGNVYQVAAGTLNSAPLNFGTVQVGQNVSQVLSITNSATGVAGFVEDLNASFGSSSGTGAGLISGTGSISNLVAGATNTSAMTVTVNTSAAGSVNGNIAVNYSSAGAVNGVSNGLGVLGVGSSSYGVNGVIQAQANVVNQASPVINNSPINLGNVRVGTASPVGTVSVTNQATVAPQAALNASIGSATAGITTNGGSFNLLNPGATDASSLQVGIDTASAGAKNGTATIAFVSDASNIGNCAPNCQLNLASQNVTVTGNVYRLANPTLNTGSVSLAARVGDAVPTAAVSVTNTSPDAFTEGLKANLSGASAGFGASGSIANLVAGQSDNSSLQVSLNTGTAGTFGGTVTANYTSTGAGTTGAADLAIGSGTVNLSGKVYTVAAGQVSPTNVNFGIVHVGDVVGPQNIAVTNTAAVTALNDTLTGSFGGASGPFSATGNLGSGVQAGNTDNASLNASLNTAVAGIYNGQGFVNLSSHNSDMSDLALGVTAVNLQATVNNYAKPEFAFNTGFGSFSGSGNNFILDFGTVQQGSGIQSASLFVTNATTGPSDFLDGSYCLSGQVCSSDPLLDFLLSNFNAFSNLGAGSNTGLFSVGFDTASLGFFQDEVDLISFGHNASGYSAQFADVTLTIRGNVIAQGNNVPEPGSFALGIAGLLALTALRRRRAAATLA